MKQSALLIGLWLGLLLASGCSTAEAYIARPGVYDRIPEEWQPELLAARQALDSEDYRSAHDLVLRLVRKSPWLLPLRVQLQELQLGLLLRGEKVGLGYALPEGSNYSHELGDLYRQRAEGNPSAAEYVLASRLAPTREEALKLLKEAEALDSDCVWIHYARAWWAVSERRFPEAREALKRAFALDGGHLPSMRLQASLLAAAGETPEALRCLRSWLERRLGDPLVDPGTYAEAQVDLASLHILNDDDAQALRTLGGVNVAVLQDPARMELVRSVALAARGNLAAALRSADHAASMDSTGLLPLVHRAMLLQREGKLEAERLAWQAVVDQAKAELLPQPIGGAPEPKPVDFTSLLLELRAHARLGRIEQQHGPAPGPAPGPL